MRFAFLLYDAIPFGGLQRDLARIVAELVQRGHYCRLYCNAWQGAELAGVDVRRVPGFAFGRRRRSQRFHTWVQSDLARNPVDGVIGFNKMPGLDICYAADACYVEQAMQERRSGLHRRSAHFRHFANWERAVFAPDGATQILLLSASQRDAYQNHYHTPPQHLHLLPPGVAADRRAPPDASQRRKVVREHLGIEPQELTLLFVASRFFSKGLDRAIAALAHARDAQPSVKLRLLIVGQDKPRHFQRQAKRLKVADGVEFLGGRDDITDLMLGADLLVHPARAEAAGVVLLEALAAGLPVVTTDNCGYAQYVKAARAGILLPTPFSQQQLERAVLRFIDGVFRAECRESALLFARLTDLYSMPRLGADVIETLIKQKQTLVAG